MTTKEIDNLAIDIMSKLPDDFLLEHHVEIRKYLVEALHNMDDCPSG